jgi:hypothetical protein
MTNYMDPDHYYEARVEDYLKEVGAADEFMDEWCPDCDKRDCQCEGGW